MSKKGKRRIAVRIDMTPMVDIAFLLLIFYMTTTQFKPPEQKQVVLPTSTSQRQLPLKNFITITVTKQDSVFLDFIIKAKRFDPTIADSVEMPVRDYLTTTPEAVGAEIQKMRLKAMVEKIGNLFLVLKADKDASFGVVEKIMAAMQDQKLTTFQVVTDLDKTLSRTAGGG